MGISWVYHQGDIWFMVIHPIEDVGKPQCFKPTVTGDRIPMKKW